MLRKPVQIFIIKNDFSNNDIYTLCNDGTIWKTDEQDMKWAMVPNVPQPGQEEQQYHGDGEQNT